jgi:hypothetical protein
MTSNAITTAVSHFMKNPETLKNIRSEFSKFKEDAVKEDPSLASLEKADLLDKIVTPDSV